MTDGHYCYEFDVVLRVPENISKEATQNILSGCLRLDGTPAELQSVDAVRRTHTSELDGAGARRLTPEEAQASHDAPIAEEFVRCADCDELVDVSECHTGSQLIARAKKHVEEEHGDG